MRTCVRSAPVDVFTSQWGVCSNLVHVICPFCSLAFLSSVTNKWWIIPLSIAFPTCTVCQFQLPCSFTMGRVTIPRASHDGGSVYCDHDGSLWWWWFIVLWAEIMTHHVLQHGVPLNQRFYMYTASDTIVEKWKTIGCVPNIWFRVFCYRKKSHILC